MRIKKNTAPASDDSKIAVSTRKRLGIGQEAFSRFLEVSHRTVWRWEHGGHPEQSTQKDLIRLNKIISLLLQNKSPSEVYFWLVAPNPHLHYCAPVDLIRSQYATIVLTKLIERGKIL